MCVTAALVALGLGELQSGVAYCMKNPEIMSKITKFALCSAVGQSFIFYTIANFDPLVLSTVTTTRKIFSVLLSILFKGHHVSLTGWSGIALACAGIGSELHDNMMGDNNSKKKEKKRTPASARRQAQAPRPAAPPPSDGRHPAPVSIDRGALRRL